MHRQTSGGNLESIEERLWTVDCKQTNKQTDRQTNKQTNGTDQHTWPRFGQVTNRQTEPINILGQIVELAK